MSTPFVRHDHNRQALADIPAGPSTLIRVSRDAQGYVYLRTWFRKGNTWRPGKEGLEIPPRSQGRVVQALLAAQSDGDEVQPRDPRHNRVGGDRR